MATASAPAAPPRLAAHERVALLGLLLLALATAGWWALALWPAAGEPPAWLARARWVCFNAEASGLPSASGWLVLVGEPLGLGVALWAAFGTSLRGGLRTLVRSRAGRALACAFAATFALGAAAAGARITSLVRVEGGRALTTPDPSLPDPASLPRLDRPAPALGLVDQRGARIELAQLRGRPALVTFAFAHCEAVCPTLVSQTLAAQRASTRSAAGAARVVIVTLDPWRDPPSRLPALAESWRLGGDAFVLSGAPERVNAVLDAWRVPRERDPNTGQIAHPALVYVLDAEGRIAFAANGDARTLSGLLARL
jgi:protein SCO1/2